MSDLHCSIEDGAHVATVAQMVISFPQRTTLAWDKPEPKFTDDGITTRLFDEESYRYKCRV